MRKHLTKKRVFVLAVVAVVAAVGTTAFAFFSASGSGTGSASVGSASGIVLTSDSVSGLYPAGSDVTVGVHIQNPGSGDQHVGTVSGAVQTDDNGTAGDPSDDCLGTWFQVDPITYNATVTHGTTSDTSTKVRMTDSGTNQDACQGKTLTINWSSN
jgi:hypothetical protein